MCAKDEVFSLGKLYWRLYKVTYIGLTTTLIVHLIKNYVNQKRKAFQKTKLYETIMDVIKLVRTPGTMDVILITSFVPA